MKKDYTAVVKKSAKWWIGWSELPGANARGIVGKLAHHFT